MRVATTIADVAELLTDFEVTVYVAAEEPALYFTFPVTEEEKQAKPKQKAIADMYSTCLPIDDPSGVGFTRRVRGTIRSLLAGPRFRRLTTTADQLCCFIDANNRLGDSSYGTLKLRKKGTEPLTMLFEDTDKCERFYNDLIIGIALIGADWHEKSSKDI
jgi:hypothetical protein